MIQYGIIKPAQRSAVLARFETIQDAERAAGIDPQAVDHGTVRPGLAIVVYEFGLYRHPAKTSFFAIRDKFFAGGAVLYSYGIEGETRDLNRLPEIRWFEDAADADLTMRIGMIMRPVVRKGGQVIWQWPGPPPAETGIKLPPGEEWLQ